ncbi:MAG TPA: hypothetical protein VKO84_06615 [Gaiellaceae bacterium]|nr:hypothetical protein [Gaiellaceae bacterium]
MIPARRLIVPTAFATVALVVLLQIHPLSTGRALAIWIVLVAALALLLLVRRPRRGAKHASRFEAAMRGRLAKVTQPVELLRVERELELGIASAGSAHHRLLPRLRAAAASRLASRHGVELERQPEAARSLLGEHAWSLLRPDRPEPPDRFAPGIPRETVAALIDRVESL